MTGSEFEEAVRKMREHQKAFFKAKPGTQERMSQLNSSKFWEQRVDNYLASDNSQTTMQL